MGLGTQWFPCYGNATSTRFLHQPLQILVTLVLWRWALLGCKTTNKENVWVIEILLILQWQQGHGASRQKQEQGRKQSFQNCPPSAIRGFATHIRSLTPAAGQGAVIHVGVGYLVAAHPRAPNTSGRRKQVLLASWLFPLAQVPTICMLFNTLWATVQKRS